jgi:threonine dehydratase
VLTSEDVYAAAERLSGIAHRTPLITSRYLNELVGAQVFLKAECFQRAGAFKFRGAYNALSMLDPEQRRRGVVAASSGNHAQAVALAGSLLEIPVAVIMPEDAPPAKMAATRGYGAEIITFDRYKDDREKLQSDIASERGRTVVPAYDSYNVMAGQGTLALEILEDVPDLGVLIVPVSGGGLLAGCGTAVRAVSRKTQVIGAEPEAADDTFRSFAAGERINIGVPVTIADGLQAPMPGRLTFPINQRLADGILVASEDEIKATMVMLLERQKLLVEPSGAVALAALIRHREAFAGKKVVVVLSGGNADLKLVAELLGGFSTTSARN